MNKRDRMYRDVHSQRSGGKEISGHRRRGFRPVVGTALPGRRRVRPSGPRRAWHGHVVATVSAVGPAACRSGAPAKADRRADAVRGCAAVGRGPVVYCPGGRPSRGGPATALTDGPMLPRAFEAARRPRPGLRIPPGPDGPADSTAGVTAETVSVRPPAEAGVLSGRRSHLGDFRRSASHCSVPTATWSRPGTPPCSGAARPHAHSGPVAPRRARRPLTLEDDREPALRPLWWRTAYERSFSPLPGRG